MILSFITLVWCGLVVVILIGVSNMVPKRFLLSGLLSLDVLQLTKESHDLLNCKPVLRSASTLISRHARIVPVSDEQEHVNIAELRQLDRFFDEVPPPLALVVDERLVVSELVQIFLASDHVSSLVCLIVLA